MSVNLIHNAKGYIGIQGQPYQSTSTSTFTRKASRSLSSTTLTARSSLQARRPNWKCRAGARYMYVDEHGKVQLCASQLGRLGTPIEEYTKADLDKNAENYKGCEEGCSVGCAFRCSLVDNDKPAFVKAVAQGRRARHAVRQQPQEAARPKTTTRTCPRRLVRRHRVFEVLD